MKESTVETPVEPKQERPDRWWYKTYAAVVVVTIVVIALLGAFTWYFSS